MGGGYTVSGYSVSTPRGVGRITRGSLAFGALSVFGAACVGVLVARGGRLSFACAGVAVELAVIGLIVALGFRSLLVWIAASPLLYPFIRLSGPHTLVTFDRLWILGAFAGLAVGLPRARASRPSRVLWRMLKWLALAYGVRAAFTGGGRLAAVSIWFDAIVLPVILFFLASRLVVTEKRWQQVAGAFTAAGLGLAAIGIGETVFGFDLASRSGGVPRFDAALGIVRISGPYGAPEPYALALLVCFAVTLAWMQLRRGPSLVLGGVIAVLEVTAISLTFFRAAWISMIIVFVTALGLRPQRLRRLVGVTAAVAAIGFLALGSLEQNRLIGARLNGEVAKGNVSGRLATYKQGFAIFRTAPLFGVGIERYAVAQGGVVGVAYAGVSAQEHPHSSYEGMLAEQGIFGFAPLVAATGAVLLLLRAFRRRVTGRHDVLLAAAAYGASLAYLLMSLTLTMLPYGSSNAFFLLLLGVVCGRLDAADVSHQPVPVIGPL